MPGTVLLVTHDGLGSAADADRQFGLEMFDKFLHAIEGETGKPDAVCFYTEGVKLLAKDSPALLGLGLLQAQGIRLLACKTCLDKYLGVPPAVGEVADMKAIVRVLLNAERVITV